MQADRYYPLSRDDVRALWQQHRDGAKDEAPPDVPWAFVHALFTAWRRADDTRQAVLMGWTSPGGIEALQRGDGACYIHPVRTKRGGKTPVGVLYLAARPGDNHEKDQGDREAPATAPAETCEDSNARKSARKSVGSDLDSEARSRFRMKALPSPISTRARKSPGETRAPSR